MGKLLGIREVVGTGLTRDVQGVGFYEHAGTVEKQYAPYDIRRVSFGAAPASSSYDLNEPGRVAEIKRVLVALAQRASDPLQNPDDTQVEDTWAYIDRDSNGDLVPPQYADAWDGPTADAFVLAVSRYRDLVGDNSAVFAKSELVADDFGNLDMVGGPQPTVMGLEMLALAAKKYLGGSPQLNSYLSWRGGDLGGMLDSPPEAPTIKSRRFGVPWNTRGWTFALKNGQTAQDNPQLLTALLEIEQQLVQDWMAAQVAKDEAQRSAVAQNLVYGRASRDSIVRQLNVGAPAPACPSGQVFSKSQSMCVARCREGQTYDSVTGQCVVTLPPVDIVVEKEKAAKMSRNVILALIGAAALGVYVYTEKKR